VKEHLDVAPATKITYMSIVFNYCQMHLDVEFNRRNCPLVAQYLKKSKMKSRTKQATTFEESDLRLFWSKDLPAKDEWLKLVSIIAFYGWARTDDLNRLSFQNVEVVEKGVKVSFEKGKTDTDDKGGLEFLILFEGSPSGPAEILKKYIDSLPPEYRSGKLFKRWKQNVSPPGYRQQHHGTNNLRDVGKKVATLLDLRNPAGYTGHCFRRSGATHMALEGGSTKQLKRKGRWASDIMADRYIATSTRTLEKDARVMQGVPSTPEFKKRRVEDDPKEETKRESITLTNKMYCSIS